MKKRDEISDPNSCLNRAGEDETIFTLRAHDIAFPYTVRQWAEERVRLGKNEPDDEQITSALNDAREVEEQHLGEAADAIYAVLGLVPAMNAADGRDKAVGAAQRMDLLYILRTVRNSRRNQGAKLR
jgi:hypothetical protein